GITPKLNLLGITLANPSEGQKTGEIERVTIVNAGFDADLEKMAGLRGATLHFSYLYVPEPYNNGTFGAFAGDSLIGQAGPFIPLEWNLSQLTWEQKLLNNRLDVTVGIDNAGNYFGLPLCNQPFLCQSAGLQNGTGMNPPPYSNWSARAAYH